MEAPLCDRAERAMRQPTALRPPSSFVRTGFTWPAYLMLGYYAFLQAALGPLAPFLQGELHLTYTQTSLLTSTLREKSLHDDGSSVSVHLDRLCQRGIEIGK
jgi:hypothetical protein